MTAAAVVMYAIGWGPALAVGYVLVFSELLEDRAGNGWALTTLMLGALTVAGQGAIALNIVPSAIPRPEVHALAVLSVAGATYAIHAFGRSTTRLRLAEERARNNEERLHALVKHAPGVIVVVDRTGAITYASPGTERTLGRAPAVLANTANDRLVHPDDRKTLREVATSLAESPSGTVAHLEVRVRHTSGEWRWQAVTMRNLLDHAAVQGVVLNFHDITDTKRLHDELRDRAHSDPLTGLLNRAGLDERLDTAVSEGRAPLGLVFIDLDGFKQVNDRFGHTAGDALLAAVAARLNHHSRQSDVVARLGGDEFVVLVPDAHDPRALCEFAQRLVDVVHEPFDIEGRTIAISASAGVAMSELAEASHLLREADLAMYAAKEAGRCRYEPTPRLRAALSDADEAAMSSATARHV